MKQITIDIIVQRVQPPAESSLTDYYVLLHDFETPAWNHKPRSLYSSTDGLLNKMGYPEMVPMTERKGMPLTEDIQWFWFDLCVMKRYRTVYGTPAWRELTRSEQTAMAHDWSVLTDSKRFATNHAGTDNNANYVAERILGAPLKSGMPKQFEVACGGNIVKAKSNMPVNRYGVPCIEIEVWNGKDPAPDARTFNWTTHPHLIHFGTIATPFGYDRKPSATGPWRVDPFPYFNDVGSPYALYASSPNYVPLNRLRRLRADELQRSPYIP